MTLSQLDILEKEIADQLKSFNAEQAKSYATTKTVDKEVENLFLFATYKKYTTIHKAYIELIKHGDNETQTEALKRAVFLQWLSCLEPAYNTGLTTSFEIFEKSEGGLELPDFLFVYGILDKLIGQNKLDKEFVEMLSYYSTWSFIFDSDKYGFNQFKNLNNFVLKVDTTKGYGTLIKARDLNSRGHMGDYFTSIWTPENTSS